MAAKKAATKKTPAKKPAAKKTPSPDQKIGVVAGRVTKLEAKDREQDRHLRKLEERVVHLEGMRSGRKAKPIVVSEPGVCGVDPDRDSETCDDASLFRKQRGCQGKACVRISRNYYKAYRQKKKAEKVKEAEVDG